MAITPLKIRFGKLLGDYLRNAGIKQNDVAALLGVSGSAVSQMMHGKIVPDQQQLTAICELLALDCAQLFELNSMLSQNRTGAENLLSPFNHSLFALRCQRGLSIRQLANLSGVSADHIRVFETCFGAIPLPEEAEKLARVLGCSTASLLQTAGVGGLSDSAISQLSQLSQTPGNEVMEKAAAPYRAERQVPQLTLLDLDNYTPGTGIVEYARAHVTKLVAFNEFPDREIVLLQASNRDLPLGIPGTVQLVLGDNRPEEQRELNLCRDAAGLYSLQEFRRNRIREFRLAGTRRTVGETIWHLPVLELYFRPLKLGKEWKIS